MKDNKPKIKNTVKAKYIKLMSNFSLILEKKITNTIAVSPCLIFFGRGAEVTNPNNTDLTLAFWKLGITLRYTYEDGK